MLSIEVLPPIKSKTRYEFRCVVEGNALTFDEFKERAKSVVRGYGSLSRSVLRFGYTATNFEINHSELWDSIYPLHFLNSGVGPFNGLGTIVSWRRMGHNGGPVSRAGYSRDRPGAQ